MTDYSKWKVTELKAELKRRGVPQTGLKLKADFIEKLNVLDAEAQAADTTGDASIAQDGAADQGGEEEKADEPAPSQQSGTESNPTEKAPSPQHEDLPQPTEDSHAHSEDPLSVQETEKTAESAEKPTTDHLSLHPENEVVSAPAPDALPREGKSATQFEKPDIAEAQVTPQSSTEMTMDVEPPVASVTETLDDMRKRKRRSQSPPPSMETTKKARADNESPQIVLKEDVGVDDILKRKDEPSSRPPEPAAEDGVNVTEEDREPRRPSDSQADGDKAGNTRQDARFRDLVSPANRRQAASLAERPPADDDRQIEPALHPATTSIYIRGFMRPLQPANLQDHLISLASPTGESSDPDVLVDFFLDSIKTHCFASFVSVSAASRVRSSIHGAVWPNERDRKPLWADFIPEQRIREWIRMERDTESRGRTGPRWEITYDMTGDGVEAALHESRGLHTGPPPNRGRDIPTGPAPRRSLDTGLGRRSPPLGSLPTSRGRRLPSS
jgi:hypothetical protein